MFTISKRKVFFTLIINRQKIRFNLGVTTFLRNFQARVYNKFCPIPNKFVRQYDRKNESDNDLKQYKTEIF